MLVVRKPSPPKMNVVKLVKAGGVVLSYNPPHETLEDSLMYRREGITTPQLDTVNQVKPVGVRDMFTCQTEGVHVTTGEQRYILDLHLLDFSLIGYFLQEH